MQQLKGGYKSIQVDKINFISLTSGIEETRECGECAVILTTRCVTSLSKLIFLWIMLSIVHKYNYYWECIKIMHKLNIEGFTMDVNFEN